MRSMNIVETHKLRIALNYDTFVQCYNMNTATTKTTKIQPQIQFFDTIKENKNENCWHKSSFYICVILFEATSKLRDLHEMSFIKAR